MRSNTVWRVTERYGTLRALWLSFLRFNCCVFTGTHRIFSDFGVQMHSEASWTCMGRCVHFDVEVWGVTGAFQLNLSCHMYTQNILRVQGRSNVFWIVTDVYGKFDAFWYFILRHHWGVPTQFEWPHVIMELFFKKWHKCIWNVTCIFSSYRYVWGALRTILWHR